MSYEVLECGKGLGLSGKVVVHNNCDELGLVSGDGLGELCEEMGLANGVGLGNECHGKGSDVLLETKFEDGVDIVN